MCVCVYFWRAFDAVVAICVPVKLGSVAGLNVDRDWDRSRSWGLSPARPLTIKVNEYFNIGKQITHMGNGNVQGSHDLCQPGPADGLKQRFPDDDADMDKHSSNGVKFNSIELNCCWHNASKANATIRCGCGCECGCGCRCAGKDYVGHAVYIVGYFLPASACLYLK